MVHPDLEARLESYLRSWAGSQAAARVDAVEGFALNHGFNQYEGQTIPEFITFVLNDLLVFLAERPNLIDTVISEEEATARVDKFLAEEQAKIDEAGALLAEIKSYWFGPLDPRYRRASKKYHAVVTSFRLTDGEKTLTVPPVYELKN